MSVILGCNHLVETEKSTIFTERGHTQFMHVFWNVLEICAFATCLSNIVGNLTDVLNDTDNTFHLVSWGQADIADAEDVLVEG